VASAEVFREAQSFEPEMPGASGKALQLLQGWHWYAAILAILENSNGSDAQVRIGIKASNA
jgi:hypothetical protein